MELLEYQLPDLDGWARQLWELDSVQGDLALYSEEVEWAVASHLILTGKHVQLYFTECHGIFVSLKALKTRTYCLCSTS